MSCPTKPGWYWYREGEGNHVAAEVFMSGDYHGNVLISYIPDHYNYLPTVSKLTGEWSDQPIQSPPWEQNEYSNGVNNENPRGTHNQ